MSKYWGPQAVSLVERSIIHYPYLGGSTIGGFTVLCSTLYCELCPCRVTVVTSSCPVPSINNTGHVTDWFDSLAECLHWNVRKEQKALDASK